MSHSHLDFASSSRFYQKGLARKGIVLGILCWNFFLGAGVLFALEEKNADHAGPGAPETLTVEDRQNPLGIDDPTPEFGWLTHDSRQGAAQSAYQILVASSPDRLVPGKADRWDSGVVQSDRGSYISYAGKPLSSRETLFWTVRTADACGHFGPWALAARFEMGLLTNDDWTAHWIWRNENGPSSETKNKRKAGHSHGYFRHAVRLHDRPIVRARAYLSTCHQHFLYVNGRQIGQGPNFAYPDTAYYQTFDLTDVLKPGEANLLGLRCHWYGKGQGRPTGTPGTLLQIEIRYDDGQVQTVVTDGSWKTRATEWRTDLKRFSRNGEGVPPEWIVAGRHPSGWTEVDYNDSDWQKPVDLGRHPVAPWDGRLLSQETRIAEYPIEPVSLRTLGPGHVVADFGKVYAGRPEVQFSNGTLGDEALITTGYRAKSDGTLLGFEQNTDMTYRYTLGGDKETFLPFGYLGFRHVEVQITHPGEDTPTKVDIEAIRLIVRHHEVETDRASFDSSDAMLNAIWDLACRSTMLGSQEHFVDTPTREQGQFTYDAYLTSMASMRVFLERDLTQKGIREFAQSQERFHLDTGKVNAVYPNGDGGRDIPDWTQSWVFWVRDYFWETADRELVEAVMPHLIRTGEYLKRSENPRSGLIDWGDDQGYRSGITDWPKRYGYDRKTTQRTVLSVNAQIAYRCIAELAGVLGDEKAQKRFGNYAEMIEKAINQRLWSETQSAYIDGLYADGKQSTHASQQANVIALAAGLASPDRVSGALTAAQKVPFSTGPILSRFVVQGYGNHDADEAFYDLLLNPKGRNWAHIVTDGGTFTYENWGGRNDKPENSESHPCTAYGAVMALQNYVLGVTPLKPGWAEIQVRPHPGPLAYAGGVVPSQRGPITIAWRQANSTLLHKKNLFEMDLNLPCNLQARVFVPQPQAHSERDFVLTLNGKPVQATKAGNYFALPTLGAGQYSIRLLAK